MRIDNDQYINSSYTYNSWHSPHQHCPISIEHYIYPTSTLLRFYILLFHLFSSTILSALYQSYHPNSPTVSTIPYHAVHLIIVLISTQWISLVLSWLYFTVSTIPSHALHIITYMTIPSPVSTFHPHHTNVPYRSNTTWSPSFISWLSTMNTTYHTMPGIVLFILLDQYH